MESINFKYYLFVIVFLLVVDLTHASSTDKYVLFLSGVLLIEENRNLSSEKKAVEYRKLQNVTGVNSYEVMQYIENLRNPSEVKEIYSRIVASLTGKYPEDIKKEVSEELKKKNHLPK